MSAVARYIGLDEVLEVYETESEQAYFSVWDKGARICQYNGEEKTEGIQILTREIERNIKMKYNNILLLLLHTEQEASYKKNSPAVYSCMFKSFQPEVDTQNQQRGNFFQSEIYQRLIAAEAENKILQQRLLQQDESEDEDEDEGEEQNSAEGIISGVNQLLAHPVVSNLVAAFLGNGIANKPTASQSLAGVDDDAEVLNCFRILKTKGVTIDHLKALAKWDKKQIEQILQFL